VSAGFAFRGVFGIELERIKPGAVGLAQGGAMVVGAANAAAAFAYACYAALRAVMAVAIVAAFSQAISAVISTTTVGATFGVTVAAITIALVSHAVAGRISVPPLVIVVPAIIPFRPGLSIYKGLSLLAEGRDGVPDLATAAVTAVALASG
jgi:uncharacterized membrane protein YjjB (DUF3815 family)